MRCVCGSERIANVSGKTGDLISVRLGENEIAGEGVPDDMGIGGGDYIRFRYCLDCGRIHGDFPLPPTRLEESE